MKKYTRGFTLIELLVVIAIIGILSSVVLVSLNSARSKGQDAKVQSQLSGLRAAMEIYYSNHSNKYQAGSAAVTACNVDPFNVTAAADGNPSLYITDTDAVAGTTIYCGVTADGSAYAVQTTLPSNPTGATGYCVDSVGKSKVLTAAPSASITVCP